MTEDKEQEAIDITIKRGVDKKYDDELGLTGRPACIVICRMAAALEERDELIESLRGSKPR